MTSDEEEIRQLVATWLDATKAGDVKKVLSLMTDDALFLLPGRPPMRKPEFAAAARQQAHEEAPRIEGTSEIEEIEVHGDRAYLWQRLTVVTTPLDGSAATTRAGHTLTIFRKQDGRWLLARDANLVVPVER